MELTAIKTDRLYVKVADQITTLVEQQVLKPGSRLPSERTLAEQLNVSRPIIREAMIALELSGIIEIRTGSGIFINEVQTKLPVLDKGAGPFEILQLRLVVETEACALAAQYISQAQLLALQQAISGMEGAVNSKECAEAFDHLFHSIIADASNNSAISSVINWLWELRKQSDLSRSFSSRLLKRGVHPSIHDHKEIYQALSQGDSEKSRQAMRKHIEQATEDAATFFDSTSFKKIKV
ncbi:GntR family transcriptional regulator [Saccharobesus litoralis]|uniref:GntR family transcriptional regulator n=2 Tax=Saccharobesus litoralis TaxID=2172099 RepID=A0A2S0VPG9_9ALTE|nr:GntR family transcriptional regulator [Saccharobesus litoralis]